MKNMNTILLFGICFLFLTYHSYSQTPYDYFFSSNYSFYDNFDYKVGNETDQDVLNKAEFKNRWLVGNCWGTLVRTNSERQMYMPDNLVFDKNQDLLKLEARERHIWGYLQDLKTWTETDPNDTINWKEHFFTSGRITSKQEFLFGKFEAEIKIPKGTPYWPAFWLIGCGAGKSNEIDIFEFGSGNYNEPHFTYHDWDVEPNYGCGHSYPSSEDYSTGFHKYTLIWLPDRMVWYVDGIQRRIVYSYEPGFPKDPAKINLNLAVSWGTFNSGEIPNSLQIKNVKAWSLNPGYEPNAFETLWSNVRFSNYPDWNNNSYDKAISGNFDANTEEELLLASPNTGFIQLRNFDNSNLGNVKWNLKWQNAFYVPPGQTLVSINDIFLSGNFESSHSKDELLVINPSSGQSRLDRFYTYSFSTEWENNGNDKIGSWITNGNDKFLAANFDGTDSKEELLCINPSGWSKIMKYNPSYWAQEWSNGGDDKISYWVLGNTDQYVAGNFNASDTKDELLCINPSNGWSKIVAYNGSSWYQSWSNGGNDQIDSWNISWGDKYHAFDYDGDGVEELLCYNIYNGWSKLMSYSSGSWTQIWSNGGDFKLNNWNFKSESLAVVGNFTSSNKQQIFSVVSDFSNVCPDYENFLSELPDQGQKNKTTAKEENMHLGTENLSKIRVYPNPANEILHIELGKIHEFVSISIRDTKGEILQSYNKSNQENLDLNLLDLAAGVYFIEIQTSGQKFWKKMIKI